MSEHWPRAEFAEYMRRPERLDVMVRPASLGVDVAALCGTSSALNPARSSPRARPVPSVDTGRFVVAAPHYR